MFTGVLRGHYIPRTARTLRFPAAGDRRTYIAWLLSHVLHDYWVMYWLIRNVLPVVCTTTSYLNLSLHPPFFVLSVFFILSKVSGHLLIIIFVQGPNCGQTLVRRTCNLCTYRCWLCGFWLIFIIKSWTNLPIVLVGRYMLNFSYFYLFISIQFCSTKSVNSPRPGNML